VLLTSAQLIPSNPILIVSSLKNYVSLYEKISAVLGSVKTNLQTYLARALLADWLIMDSAIL
jgi:hypothetical protein